MIKLLLIGMLLAYVPYSVMTAVNGAKCAPATFDAEFEQSAAVFIGEVIKIEKKGDNRVIQFEVERFWKGVESRLVTVSVSESMRYQAIFEGGKSYLVFAKGNDDGSLFDGRCSHSAEIDGYSSSLKGDLEKLGDAKTCINLKESEKNEN